MNRKLFYRITLLLYALGMIALGIIILAQGDLIVSFANLLGGLVIIIHGCHLLFNYFFDKKENARHSHHSVLTTGLINLFGGIIILVIPNFTFNILLIAFVVYVLLNALVKLIDYVNFRRSNTAGRLYDLIACIFFTTFGLLAIFVPQMGRTSLLIVAGIYCILYGSCQLSDFIRQLIPRKAKNIVKRRIRFSVPVFISTFMPLKTLKEFNRIVATDEGGASRSPLARELIEKDEDAEKKADMELLIHASVVGVGVMGHCDICVDGNVISYGNYDARTFKLFGGLGDGVMFESEFKRYIRFQVTEDYKTIFSYGLRLGEEKMKEVRAEIEKLKANAYEWKPPFELARAANPNAKIEDYTDYCSSLWKGTHATYYKFRSGRFKTYFVMSTNCALLLDSIIGKAGTDIVKINGIITPGSYFDYMEYEFMVPDSMVVSRRIYTLENTADWDKYLDTDPQENE